MTPPSRDLYVYDSVLDTIGWTPLIRLQRVTQGIRTPVWVKMESRNPGASIKDRIGIRIIERAEREGKLKPGGTIVEGTSGNTGVGLALAATQKGYHCIFTMPDKMSQEKVRLLKAYGAEVIITPTAVPPDHPDNYVMMAKRIASETPNAPHHNLVGFASTWRLISLETSATVLPPVTRVSRSDEVTCIKIVC